jgi:hypothetical protein
MVIIYGFVTCWVSNVKVIACKFWFYMLIYMAYKNIRSTLNEKRCGGCNIFHSYIFFVKAFIKITFTKTQQKMQQKRIKFL